GAGALSGGGISGSAGVFGGFGGRFHGAVRRVNGCVVAARGLVPGGLLFGGLVFGGMAVDGRVIGDFCGVRGMHVHTIVLPLRCRSGTAVVGGVGSRFRGGRVIHARGVVRAWGVVGGLF